ncbi:early nodulin-like protein 1 [Brachypodium distachyon]|uniref:Phytocyanin domain-containing protein n=1 Tax=Brachypodium distachyon TaxID=15368 RepID=I1HXI8_BRADI|nr:early nodulin-like protein 1 [Brachypodium distachyon]KQJ93474.1 hypothetical protein BRADI_3g04777v3 [Brachypodium distachyon]|eukprot:XP_010236279.1 early nodulin-like protein 1 [Brachypodium distachyon]
MSSRRSRAAGLVLACAALMAAVSGAGAAKYTVGGDNGWAVPAAGAESYNTWAEKTGFQTGDQLLFVYPKDKDSVLLVEPAGYNACNTSAYDKAFSDGSTVFDLDRAGAFFFISGVDANCRANEKLIVMVSAAKGAPPPSQQGSSPSPPSGDADADAGSAMPSSPNTPATPNSPPAAANNSTANGGPPAAANGAGFAVAGFAGLFMAWFGYAMLGL